MVNQKDIEPALPQLHIGVRLFAWILLPFTIILALNSPDITTNIKTFDAVTTSSDVELFSLFDDVGVDLGHDGDHEEDSSTSQTIEVAIVGDRTSLPMPSEVHNPYGTLFVIPSVLEPSDEIFVPPPANVS